MTAQTLGGNIRGVLRMDRSIESQLPRTPGVVILRSNRGAIKDEPPTKLTEAEAYQLLAVCFKDPQRAINRLKRGDKLETRYATYVARMV